MKKLAALSLALVFVFALVLTSCKTPEKCPAYSKTATKDFSKKA